MKLFIGSLFLLVVLCSCGTVRKSPKYEFANGYYKAKLFSPQPSPVYVINDEDYVTIYPVKKMGKIIMVDTSRYRRVALPQLYIDGVQKHYAFHKRSFDVDFLTIPFKYRQTIKSVPKQFNTNLNGGVYLGYHNDSYVVKYHKDPLRGYGRQNTHFGISMSGLVGLGGTALNPWVSNDQIQLEYDALVWINGIACIMAINNEHLLCVWEKDKQIHTAVVEL